MSQLDIIIFLKKKIHIIQITALIKSAIWPRPDMILMLKILWFHQQASSHFHANFLGEIFNTKPGGKGIIMIAIFFTVSFLRHTLNKIFDSPSLRWTSRCIQQLPNEPTDE